MGNLNLTFRKELKGKKITIDFQDKFTLTPYELNQIRYWINVKSMDCFVLPHCLPVSKRFTLDFIRWNNIHFNHVLLCKFAKKKFL